ncbi:MAG: hypothetical protein LC104_19335 [Bacteroidales bacterium]|nr:hypothetical protein [Bacteroidales bacterium]
MCDRICAIVLARNRNRQLDKRERFWLPESPFQERQHAATVGHFGHTPAKTVPRRAILAKTRSATVSHISATIGHGQPRSATVSHFGHTPAKTVPRRATACHFGQNPGSAIPRPKLGHGRPFWPKLGYRVRMC